ncbi:histidinol-phosphate transaminase [Paenibacillus sp. S150]|uniref:histidinol-phosphate transaminase n=1 Tax=Paenibacillus sp. S150 TaxID=2749826 RepID=UPI001C56642C|nr:histidinol-phosphate transaminase [Paenibacillus sp. S150]MBW4079782.1 histidinol-phosphate transaminase [Paenibacillus sp. S150]
MGKPSYRKELDHLPSYRPAKSLEEIQRELGLTEIIKLSGNENCLGASPLAGEAVRNAAGQLYRYADSTCMSLRGKLARRLNLPEEQLIFGNGSFEIVSLIAQAFLEPGQASIIPEPTFGWYRIASLAAGADLISVPLTQHAIDLTAVSAAISSKAKVIWLCNPNNPTGTIFSGASLQNFMKTVPEDTVVVLDEAYYEYVQDAAYPESANYLALYSNLIILRTFSKVYGLAAMRIGYGIAHPDLIGLLNRVRLPINVNGLAQIAAEAALDDKEFTAAVLENNRLGQDFYCQQFDELKLEYIKTETNFIMVNVEADSRSVAARALRLGISIRAGSEYGMPAWLRITIGTPAQNKRVVDMLRQVLFSEVRI